MKIIENKVKDSEVVKRLELKPFQWNLKKENKELVEKLENNILKKWYRAPVFVWHNKNNYILDWHQRLKALNNLYNKWYALENDEVPVVNIIAETEWEAREIIMEQHARYSEFDLEVLPQFIEWLDLEDIPVSEVEELSINFDDLWDDITEEDELVPEEPQKVIVRKWDIFKLWSHYLMCWDSTSKEDVEKLMNKENAQMIFTDPPYNVKVSNIWWLWNVKHDEFMMASWEMSEEEFTEFLSTVFKNLVEFSIDGSIHYICMDWKHIYEIMTAIKQNYTEFKNLCIWNKDNGWMWTFYRSKHELIFTCKNWTEKHINNFELWQNWRYRTNVWDYKWVNSFGSNREDLKLHPTVKPLELVVDAILDCSKKNWIILDLFGWSWSTLIASEKTWRRCYMMELDEKYVQVIIKRFYNITGWEKEIKCLNRNINIEEIIA